MQPQGAPRPDGPWKIPDSRPLPRAEDGLSRSFARRPAVRFAPPRHSGYNPPRPQSVRQDVRTAPRMEALVKHPTRELLAFGLTLGVCLAGMFHESLVCGKVLSPA